ncbi:MAG: NAD kinase [Nocardioidaceae bacterium]
MTPASDSSGPVDSAERRVLLITHTGRPAAVDVAREVTKRLTDAGMRVRMLAAEAIDLGFPAAAVPAGEDPGEGCEVAVAIGGDGTILRAAEVTRPSGTPVVGINLGHVGFLAEAESDDLEATVRALVSCSYVVEERMTLDVDVVWEGEVVSSQWALNEASVEKAARERMLEVVMEVDGRPLSRWGCDGVVFATPTGSTAYAFSAGGPVVWPQVNALLLVPLSAHALFARPMVVAPTSLLAVEVLADTQGGGVLWCDGRRTLDLPPGARIEVTQGERPVRLARLRQAPFSDRRVAKFDLPVGGWRGAAERRRDRRERESRPDA